MEERFKVIDTHGKCSIPWLIIAPHEGQALKNHGQTLERLNQRGGLSWSEMLAVLEDRRFEDICEVVARKKVEAIVIQNVCTVQMVKDDEGYVPKECCTFTNPATSGGISEIDDVNMPCGDCERECNECVIQRIFNEYAEITGQVTKNLSTEREIYEKSSSI